MSEKDGLSIIYEVNYITADNRELTFQSIDCLIFNDSCLYIVLSWNPWLNLGSLLDLFTESSAPDMSSGSKFKP